MKKGFIGVVLAVILALAAAAALSVHPNSDPHPVCPPGIPNCQ